MPDTGADVGIVAGVAIAGLALLVVLWRSRPPPPRSTDEPGYPPDEAPARLTRAEQELMRMALGDWGKARRLIQRHGSAEAAVAAWRRDLRADR